MTVVKPSGKYACFNLFSKFRYKSTPLTVTMSLRSCLSRKSISLSSMMFRLYSASSSSGICLAPSASQLIVLARYFGGIDMPQHSR